jgi:hypothetical protein
MELATEASARDGHMAPDGALEGGGGQSSTVVLTSQAAHSAAVAARKEGVAALTEHAEADDARDGEARHPQVLPTSGQPSPGEHASSNEWWVPRSTMVSIPRPELPAAAETAMAEAVRAPLDMRHAPPLPPEADAKQQPALGLRLCMDGLRDDDNGDATDLKATAGSTDDTSPAHTEPPTSPTIAHRAGCLAGGGLRSQKSLFDTASLAPPPPSPLPPPTAAPPWAPPAEDAPRVSTVAPQAGTQPSEADRRACAPVPVPRSAHPTLTLSPNTRLRIARLLAGLHAMRRGERGAGRPAQMGAQMRVLPERSTPLVAARLRSMLRTPPRARHLRATSRMVAVGPE